MWGCVELGINAIALPACCMSWKLLFSFLSVHQYHLGGCRTKTKMPASHTRVQVSVVPGPSPGKILFKKTPQVILMSGRVEIPWAGVIEDGP